MLIFLAPHKINGSPVALSGSERQMTDLCIRLEGTTCYKYRPTNGHGKYHVMCDIICKNKEVGMQILHKIIPALTVFVLFACQSKQDGALEGTVTPLNVGAKITAMQNGKNMSSVDANTLDGKFRMALAPGRYDISVTAPSAPFPMSFPGINIEPGKTTTLPVIELTPATGKANLSGKIIPPSPGSEVKLIYEGKERAAVHTDNEGKYEFKELPAGTYVLRASAPGHAEDAAQVIVSENQKTEQNAVLFPITPIEGVDWATGKIHATGIGMPPQKDRKSVV